MATEKKQPPSAQDMVQLDCSVVMQIIRHVDSETDRMTLAAGDPVQGFLTGLVSATEKGASRVEITKCFPSPQVDPVIERDDENGSVKGSDEVSEMLQVFRELNYDYECVGFYQAFPFGTCYDEEVVRLLVEHQKNIDHGIALIYDPIRTEQGKLSLRAFRLSPAALELCSNVEFGPEEVQAAGLAIENLFVELPVVIKNSRLTNVFLAQLSKSSLENDNGFSCGAPALKLSSPVALEQCTRQLVRDTEGLRQTVDSIRKYPSRTLLDAWLNLSQTAASADYVSRTITEDEAKLMFSSLLATSIDD
ncbi:hypothetical protein QR680_011935 [Steinernema hermaphroditum]|uniref:MPN domain-containing protein n=1 Tax=Steinernema hermaphroditum TaxID=289476 RepID=A0AA39LZL9_9BILA|nr:hypothetical protein QR680_011935 [Steinernema hermaphroditum]